MSDRDLVERTIAGDHAAFACLYDQYAPLVRSICYEATAELSSAQDLTQDVFIRAFDKLSAMKNPDSFGGWVAGIARYAGKEWRRKQRRDRHEFQDQLPNTYVVEASNDDARLAAMREAMSELDEHERFALDAFYLQAQSVSAARSVLQMSQSGFYKLLDRARHKLGRAIQVKHQDLY